MARAPSQAGQSLALTALLILGLTLAAMLTFSIGQRVREKIKMQALADASAYSLAAAEARAFNYYAWSNRAIVSHYVAMLSVSSYDSYLSFYQDLLSRVGANYWMMAVSSTGPRDPGGPLYAECNQRPACTCSHSACIAVNRVIDIAKLYFTHLDDPWKPNQWATVGDYLGAESFALEFQHKESTLVTGDPHLSWCNELLLGIKDHYGNRVPAIRYQQLDIETQLLWYLSGTPQYRSPIPPAPLQFGTSEDIPDPIVPNQKGGNSGQFGIGGAPEFAYSMPDQLAMLSDPLAQTPDRNANQASSNMVSSGSLQMYTWPASTLTASGISFKNYAKAVNNYPYNEHDDYDEILFGTRYGDRAGTPQQRDWITDRGFLVNAPHWQSFLNRAQALAGNDTTTTIVTEEGNALAVDARSNGYTDPGKSQPPSSPVFNTPTSSSITMEYPPFPGPVPYSYSIPSDVFLTGSPPLGAWDGVPVDGDNNWTSPAGWAVASLVHNPVSFGTSFALASEDHGEVTTRYQLNCPPNGGCLVPDGKFWHAGNVRIGRDAVYGDTGHPGAGHNHGMHVWSSIPYHEAGHAFQGAYNFNNYPNNVDELCSSPGGCGLYQGHMQFLYTDDADALFNQPRTLVMLQKPIVPAVPNPWDFDFTVGLLGSESFTTRHSAGDQASTSNASGSSQPMLSALSGGLVYYHRPEGADHDDWKEPPNLWNPFWRAKLHPIREADGLSALGHDLISNDDEVAKGIAHGHHPFNY